MRYGKKERGRGGIEGYFELRDWVQREGVSMEGYLSSIIEGRGGEGKGFFAFFVGSSILLEFFSPFVSYKRHKLHCV